MNIKDYKDFYVFIEMEGEKISDASLELLGEAKRLQNIR